LIVVDASALIDVFLRAPLSERLQARLFVAGESLHAPHLVDIEFAQAMRRHVASGGVTLVRATEALQDMASLRLRRYPHGRFLDRVWELRHNLTAYDASYVALAEALDAPLVTRDRKLAVAPGHRARIELL
jgi:predicted nucleic acid-binding protein